MAWAVFNLLRHKGVWEKSQDDEYLGNVVNETLRLYPPAVVSARMAVQEFEFAGKRIKKGTFLLYSPYVTHRLAEVWPDPLRFDPDRWERKPAPHEFLPFGGGPHRCIGAGLAVTELTVMLKALLQRPKPARADQRGGDAPEARHQNPSSRVTVEARQAPARKWFQRVQRRRYSGQ